MSERESDKGSVYKQKLRAKAKTNKDNSKKTQKSDTDKAYETDGPASVAGSTRTLDRAYESDTLGVPSTGYVPPLPLVREQTQYPRLNKSHNKTLRRPLRSQSRN